MLPGELLPLESAEGLTLPEPELERAASLEQGIFGTA